ncbi:MAG: hypothetical protein ABH848_05025, partial [Candidatus Omnitrophota bacterium]
MEQEYPLPQDDVYIDANSISWGSSTITADMPRLGADIDFTGVINTPTFSLSNDVEIHGSITLVSAMTFSGASQKVSFYGRGPHTITSNTTAFPEDVDILAFGGTYTLQDAISVGTGNDDLTLSNGTFDANDYNVTVGRFQSGSTTSRTLTMGSGTWTVDYTAWNINPSNLVLNCGTSTIKFTNNSSNAKTFDGGGLTYYNFWNATSSTGITTIQDSNTFNDLKIDAGREVNFTAGTTQTVTTFYAIGTLGSEITLHSTSDTKANLVKSGGGVIQGEYLIVNDLAASPADTWYAGANSTDGTDNTGWTFTNSPARYWVGGTADWDATAGTKWAYGSGGIPGGAAVPTSSDDVYFDANSGTGTVTIAATANCADLDCTGFTGTLAGASALNIYGSLTLDAGMTLSASGTWTFASTSSGNTVTTDGVTLTFVPTFNGVSGGWTLQDAFDATGENITLTNGTLDTNGKTVTCAFFSSTNSNTRTLTFGASTINCNDWNTPTVTNLTFNPNTSIIKVLTSGTFQGGGLTFNEVQLNNSSTLTISGTNTFANLTRTGTAAKTDELKLSANQIITGTLTINGNSAINRLLVYTDTLGTARTLTAAVVSVSNSDFMDITGAGAASWDLSAITGGSGNCGGNTMQALGDAAFTTADDLFWVDVDGGNWSDTASWSTSTGGGSGARVPLPQDDVYIDANSITSGSRTITADMPRLCKDLDGTGVLNSPAIGRTVINTIYGSINLGGLLEVRASGSSYDLYLRARSDITLTSNGKDIGKNASYDITVDLISWTLTLQDDFYASSARLNCYSGAFDANDCNVAMGDFTSLVSSSRTLTMGSGTWTILSTFWYVTPTNLVLNCDTSTIKFTNNSASTKTFRTWPGTELTYYNFWNATEGAGILEIKGSNTFNDFKIDAGREVHFEDSETQTVSTFTAMGTSGNEITIRSTDTSTKANLAKSGGGYIYSDYMIVNDLAASPASTWYMGANSTDGEDNTGMIFTVPPYRCWVGGTADWDGTAGSKWAYVTGGTAGAPVPTSTDNVILDANSGANTVTIAATANCLDLTATGFTGTLAGSSALNIYGDLTLDSGMTLTASGTWTFASTSAGQTITTDGETVTFVTVFNGVGGEWTLQDAFDATGENITLTNGTLDTNGKTVTCATFNSSNSNTRTLTLGASTINCNDWNTSTTTNLTFNVNTSTINVVTSGWFYGGGLTFNDVNLTNSGTITMTGANTFANLTRTGTAAKTDELELSANQVVTTTFTANGNSATNRLLVYTNTLGTSYILTAAVVSVSNSDFMDITGAGAASWDLSAITGGSGNC